MDVTRSEKGCHEIIGFKKVIPLGTDEEDLNNSMVINLLQECFSDHMFNYDKYLSISSDQLNSIKHDDSMPIEEKKEKIDIISNELNHIESLENLTFGLLEYFFKLVEEYQNGDVKSRSNFKKETLKLISTFHNSALKMNDTEFFQHLLNQYHPNGNIRHEKLINNHQKINEVKKDNLALDLVDDMLKEVSDSADHLEENMNNNKFADNPKMHGSLETVVRLEEDEGDFFSMNEQEGDSIDDDEIHSHHRLVGLVDRDNNEYVLTRPHDLTVFYEDAQLLRDIIVTIVSSFVFGSISNSIGLPAFLGYIIAGCLLGPAGYNVIQELIQTETLSQLGVVFIVFMLGLGFSFEKLKSSWKFALGSASLIFISTLSFFIFSGFIIGASINQAIFIGACVSLSSTTVVERLKCQELEPLYALPALSKSGIDVILAIGHLLLSLMVFFGLSYIITKLPVAWILRTTKKSNNHELFLLGSISLCLLMSQFSLLLGLGVEIGCFVAGVFIHNCRYIIDSSIGVVEPVKDLFSCLFFASIGLHIYPSFLINEAPLLLILTAGAVGFKFINSSLALAILGHPIQRASTMAVGLAQISEFAFVLGSRAKGYGIISREAYYLLLTTTSLTLVVTPILWNILFNKKKDFNSSIGGGNTGGVIPFSINNPGKVE
ncbi:7487_t:CDS:2 [Entrophospora sp. SA101]|nr:7487_t:CDS:2 [Entrophospora sp. SA101]